MNSRNSNLGSLYELSREAVALSDFDLAVQYADRLMEASGGSHGAVEWAVQVRLQGKRWQSAIYVGRLHLARDPSSKLFALVAHAHEAIGEDSLAESAFKQALLGDPENAPWLYHRAAALLRLFREFEAMELLRQAVVILPNPVCLLRLAELELAMGTPSAALSAADEALKVAPGDPIGQTLAARSLEALNRPEEAATRWEIAVAMTTDQGQQVELLRAKTLLQQGDYDAGTGRLTQLIEAFPSWPPASVQLVFSKKMTEEDRPAISRLEGLLTEVGATDRSSVEYALGKAYDDLHEYESAITHFDEANRIALASIEARGRFHREGYAANMEIRKDVFNFNVVDLLQEDGLTTEMPIFVIGMIRSGTTLAEQILSSHPSVKGAGELSHWTNADLRLIDYPNRLLNVTVLRDVAGQYLRLISELAGGAERVVDKQPGNLLVAGALNIAFPNARIICMGRNPLDTAISIWTTQIKTTTTFVHDRGNIVHASRQHENLVRHWREVIPSNRFLDVSYEALITDRERETRRMLEFCELSWSDDCLTPEKGRGRVATPSAWQVRQPVYASSIGRWRNYEPWLGEFRQLLSTEVPQ